MIKLDDFWCDQNTCKIVYSYCLGGVCLDSLSYKIQIDRKRSVI